MRWFVRLELSPLDARVLRATDPLRERTAARVAEQVGCGEVDLPRFGGQVEWPGFCGDRV